MNREVTVDAVLAAPVVLARAAAGLADTADGLGREDLAARLRVAAARASRPATIVCVVGEFKQGKSSLVNALVGRPVCPVDDDLATSAITLLRYGEDVGVQVRRREGDQTVVEDIDPASIPDWVTEAGNPENAKGVERVDIAVPSPLLANGLVLVDTPGMGGLGAGHAAATLAFLPFADGLIFVSDASSELSAPEVEFLREARAACPSVVFALTKTDLYGRWRDIEVLDAGHLDREGIAVAPMAMSSHLRSVAADLGDAMLDDESGFPTLLAGLDRDVVAPAKDVAGRRAATEAVGALDQLEPWVRGELEALADPARGAAVAAEAAAATERIEHLRGPAARWTIVVGDRVTDLSNDVTFRFRDAMRKVVREIEDDIEQLKTAKEWDDIGRDLQARVAAAVAAAFVGIETGAAAIRHAVLELLAEDIVEVSIAGVGSPIDVTTLWSGKPLDAGGSKRGKVLSESMTGLRGAQSGIIMFGMMGQFLPAGIGLLLASNPVTLGFGAVFGGLQLVDSHKRKVAQRRQQARVNARQFSDDVQFEVGNAIGEVIRTVQRAIRDEFTDRIAELHRTYADTARVAHRGDRPRRHRPRPEDRGAHGIDGIPGAAPRRPRRRARGSGAPMSEHEVRANGKAVDRVVELCDLAAELVRGTSRAAEVEEIRARMHGPLRVAIAGRVKAGKSTLLNALVGERLAATDAGECTRLVTWYQDGVTYDVHAVTHDGSRRPLPFHRADGALRIELDGLDPGTVERIEVTWPSSALRDVTLIDTPGLASIDDSNSLRTREFLAMGEDRPSDADAVIYLMRHLHRRDAEFLGAFLDRSVSAASPINAVSVLSRADEIGACRLDAMGSAGRIAARYQSDPVVRSLCTDVVPIAGLLAETGLTLREEEADALRTLAATPDDVLDRMLLSADGFCEASSSDLTVELRRGLLDRLGLYGLRLLVHEIRAGRSATGTDMARLLVTYSGLAGLRALIAERFLPRARVLQARAALGALRDVARKLSVDDPDAGRRLDAAVERVESSVLDFGQLRLAHLVLSGAVTFSAEERAEMDRLLQVDDPLPVRLALAEGAGVAELQGAALAAVGRWRTRAAEPMQDGAHAEACETMAHSFEALYAEATA